MKPLLHSVHRLSHRHHSRLLASLVSTVWLWGLLSSATVLGQALQWSQFVGPDRVGTASQSSGVAIEKAADGSIYILGTSQTGGTAPPVFPTTNIQYFGTVSGVLFTHLSKYTADGSKLLWVRTFHNGNSDSVFPMGLSLNAAGEPTILYNTTRANSGFITPDAWQPTGNFSNGGVVAVLNKFDANGNRTYGTYIGPTGGGISLGRAVGSNVNTLFTGPDGTTYLVFTTGAVASQTGVIPTTPNAYQSSQPNTGAGQGVIVMIFKPDNSLQYSSYFNFQRGNYGATMSPGGDLYVSLSNEGIAGSSIFLPPPLPNAAVPIQPNRVTGSILKFDKNGTITGNTYAPGTLFGLAVNPLTGDLVGMSRNGAGLVRVYDANLTTIKSESYPFNTTNLGNIRQIGVDAVGRLHVLASAVSNAPTFLPLQPVTTGALQTKPNQSLDQAYYGISDCTYSKVVYGTLLASQSSNETQLTLLTDLALDNCNAYIVGQSVFSPGIPVTPLAYNDNGTATLSGYDITPTNNNVRFEGFVTKFNYPTLKANTNQLATPAITTFCAGGGALPIDGTKAAYLTPFIIGTADANPAPVPIHYQWQRATSAAGPWTDLPDTDQEDLSPVSPANPGTYSYRRLVRQTPFSEAASCVPTCDVLNISNIITLTFSTNKTHTTNIPAKTYAVCKPGSLTLSTTITPGADGEQGPYTYKLTTLSDLNTTVMSQSGTVASVSSPINLSLTQPGQYMLLVTDARNCTSFDTLNFEYLKLAVASRIQFTCGAGSIKLGPLSLAPDYANIATNTFSWSPTTGLDNPNSAAPTLSTLPAAGASTDYYLTFNGCLIDTITVTNQIVTPLPALPDLARCQGDTAMLGQGITAQTGVTYEWAPGLGLTSTSTLNPIVVTLSAPAGVNVTNYTLKAQNGTTGCVQYATQKVTVYRTPNQSFQIKECMANGCNLAKPLGASGIGTVSEPGISYSWQAVIVPGTATSGLPTPADVTSGLSAPTGSLTDFSLATTSLGRANGTYQVWLIRTSQNAANPACARQDTAFYDYCTCNGNGGGGRSACELALGLSTTISCGGPNNKIGPVQYSSNGTYVWSRADGQPLNNELFDPITKLPLTPGGPHPNQVIANPAGVVAVTYNLTLYGSGGDTCRIDIKVFPGAIGKPNINYISPQAVCQGTPYSIQGPAANPNLVYLWSPSSLLVNVADTSQALPFIKGINATTNLFITITDPSTSCAVKDTVQLVVTPVTVNAGDDAAFCPTGATVPIGGSPPISGYTYQWTAVPAAGVSFGNATSAQTTATLPATAAGGKITLYLLATNGQTAANCSLKDSIVLTATTLTVTIPTPTRLCPTGQLTLGPATPAGQTYAWTGPGIVGASTGSSVNVNAPGTYTVTVSQGSCLATKTVSVSATINPVVTPNPAAPCSGPVTIGVTNAPGAGWTYTWDKLDGLKAYSADFSTISVEPTAATTYTLTATHSSGCVQTFVITVPAAAYSAQLPATLAFCEGKPAQLPLSLPPVGATIVWTASSPAALGYLNNSSVAQPTLDLSAAVAGSYSYTATVTYGAGCKSIATVTVTIGKKVLGLAGLDAQLCQGTCTTLGITAVEGLNYAWSASPATGSISNLYDPNPTVCPVQTTTYTVHYFDQSGCVFTDDVLVKVLPSPTLTVTNLSACQTPTGTATVNLASAIVATSSGLPPTYWYNASATIAAPNPVSVGGTYYVSVSDGTCSTTLPVSVTISDLPNGVLSPLFDCTSQTGTLRFSSVTATARYDYSLGNTYTGGKSFATASIIPAGGLIATNLPAPATGSQAYTVRLFGADGSCFQDIPVTLTNANCACTLAATASVSSPTVCAGSSVTLTAQVSAVGSYTYAWSGPAGVVITPGTSATATATGLLTGLNTFTVTVSSSPTCQTTATVSVNVNSLPSATLTSAAICAGQSATLTATGGTSYTFSNGTVNTTGLLVVSPTSTTAYSVTVANASGCVSTTTATVTVNSAPVLLTVQTVCAPDGQTYSIVGTVSPTSATVTDLGRTVVRNAESFTIAGILTAVGDVVTAQSVEGCLTSLTVVAPVCPIPCPLPSNLIVTTSCLSTTDGSGRITATATPSGRGSTVEYRINGGTYQTANIFDNLLNGAYTVEARIVGTNTPGCSVTTTASINCFCVAPMLTVQSPATTVCSPATFDLTSTSLITENTGVRTLYYTSLSAANAGGSAGVLSNPQAVTTSGTYYIRSEAADAACFVVRPFSVTIVDCRASLGDYVFEDKNRNGQQDTGDTPIPGVTVTLLASGTVVASTTTDVSGLYSFTGLTPGVPYSVSFVAPTGYTATATQVGGDDTKDSDANPVTGQTRSVTLASGENNPNLDAGFYLITPKLVLDKLVDKSKAKVGDILTYTLVLTNIGTANATNVTVRDSSTTGLTYVANSASAPAGTTFTQGTPISLWTVASLGAGQSLSLTFQATADSSGILYNVATLPGDTARVCTSIPVSMCPGDTYILTAPTGRSAYHWYKDGILLADQTTNVLAVTAPGTYSLGVDNAGSACPDFSCCPLIVEMDSLPVFQAITIAATCQSTIAQNNGQLVISGFKPTHTYQYSLGSTFNATASLSGAPKPIPAGGVLAANLVNPGVTQVYTVRVYNQAGCYTDQTVLLLPTVCGCPADICVPYVITQTKRLHRIGDPIK